MARQQRRQLSVLALDRAAHLVTQAQHTRVDDPVDRPGALLAAPDDTLAMQQREVLGHIRVTRGELIGDLADRYRPVTAQQIKDPYPRRVAEHREPRRDQRCEVPGIGVRSEGVCRECLTIGLNSRSAG